MTTASIRTKVAAAKTAIDAIDAAALRADTVSNGKHGNIPGIQIETARRIEALQQALARDLASIDAMIVNGA
ncbi:MAG: hypothetical protein ACOYBO_07740 [Azonexus sp.]